ncbi:MAG: hypothetical protein M3081_00895, partial [Gemmatimonadota bacterium]|nr:hypothetical protein [Gemmatimonadota bacterium]
ALVVAPESDESALERLTPDALVQRLRASSVRALDDGPSWVAMTFVSSPRRALVGPLLALAATALLLEAAVAGAGRRRSA